MVSVMKHSHSRDLASRKYHQTVVGEQLLKVWLLNPDCDTLLAFLPFLLPAFLVLGRLREGGNVPALAETAQPRRWEPMWGEGCLARGVVKGRRSLQGKREPRDTGARTVEGHVLWEATCTGATAVVPGHRSHAGRTCQESKRALRVMEAKLLSKRTRRGENWNGFCNAACGWEVAGRRASESRRGRKGAGEGARKHVLLLGPRSAATSRNRDHSKDSLSLCLGF